MSILKESLPYYVPDERIFTQSPSRIKNYMTCPRYYFYRNVLMWAGEGTKSHHLVVGTAWHAAKEYLRTHDHSNESLLAAFKLYMDVFRSYFPPEEDVQLGVKTPEVILEALSTYAMNYDHNEYTVLEEGTEVEFTIDIGEGRSLTGRVDCITEDRKGKLWVIDDKTSTRETYNWSYQWDLAMQMVSYIFATQCIFGVENVGGLVVEGTFFKKGGSTHNRAIVTKTPASMGVWYYNAMRWFDLIIDDFNMLAQVDEGKPIMQSFPMKTESCAYQYGALCSYYNLCTTWNNPLKRCSCPPMGFVSTKVEADDEVDVAGSPKNVYSDLKPVGLESL